MSEILYTSTQNPKGIELPAGYNSLSGLEIVQQKDNTLRANGLIELGDADKNPARRVQLPDPLEMWGHDIEETREVKAIATVNGQETPVTVIGIAGRQDGEIFYQTKEHQSAVPESNINWVKEDEQENDDPNPDDLKSRLDRLEADNTRLQAQIDEWRQKSSEQEQRHQQELREQEERHRLELEAQERRHQEELEQLDRQHQSQLAELRRQHEEDIAIRERDHRREIEAITANPTIVERGGRLGTILGGLALVGVVALIAMEGVNLGKSNKDTQLRKDVAVLNWKADHAAQQEAIAQKKLRLMGIRLTNISAQNKAMKAELDNPITGLKGIYKSVHRYGNHILNQTKRHRIEAKKEAKVINNGILKPVSSYFTSSEPKG